MAISFIGNASFLMLKLKLQKYMKYLFLVWFEHPKNTIKILMIIEAVIKRSLDFSKFVLKEMHLLKYLNIFFQ